MKNKIIKKILSVLLITSSLAATPVFASANGDKRQDLENAIAECDNMISECNDTIQSFEKEKTEKTQPIRDKINDNLKTLKNLKKEFDEKNAELEKENETMLNPQKQKNITIEDISKKLDDNFKTVENLKKEFDRKSAELEKENQDLLKKIESINKKYNDSAQMSREIQEQQTKRREKIQKDLDKLAEKECDDSIRGYNEIILNLQKRKTTEIESINKKLNENFDKLGNAKNNLTNEQITNLEKENQDLLKKIESINKKTEASCEMYRQLINEKTKSQKNLDGPVKKEGEDLIEQIQSFRDICSQSEINQYFKHKMMLFAIKVKKVYEKNQLTNENISEFKGEFENLKKEIEPKISKLKEKKPKKETKNKKVKPNQIKNNLNVYQQQKFDLWKKINSGSQIYKPVKGLLCWLHSATNVINYYNNTENKATFKGSSSIVNQYKKVMGDEKSKKNIDGKMKEFDQISEYLTNQEIKTFKLTISSTMLKNKEQKVINVAKEVLKTHFKSSKNQAPVISHIGNVYGHFVTIADYDENSDQLLVIDSSNLNNKSPEAKVEWKESEKFLKSLSKNLFKNDYTIELYFTSKYPNSSSCSWVFNIISDNVMKLTDMSTSAEYNSSTDMINGMIKNYY